MPQDLPKITTPLGHACPPAPGHSPNHAVTLHIPKWQTLLDFSESKPELMVQIKNAYPRIMPMVQVSQLMTKILEKSGGKGEGCFLFSTNEAARLCAEFVMKELGADGVEVRAFEAGGRALYVVFLAEEKKGKGLMFWKNAGLGVSTRLAEFFLERFDELQPIPIDKPLPPIAESNSHEERRERIIGLLKRAALDSTTLSLTTGDVLLFQCGQAAIYQLQRYLSHWRRGTTILFGFAFNATEHSLSAFDTTGSFKFFGLGTEYDELEAFLKKETSEGKMIQGLWTEFPSNPILVTPDLIRLRELADRFSFPLIVDDTIGSFCNLDLLSSNGADILVSSLTKTFSGYADVMGGSAVFNPESKYYLREQVRKLYTNDLFNSDADVLERNSKNYLARSAIHNRNAEDLADYLHTLSQSPQSPILRIHYPKFSPFYKQRMRPPTPDFTPGYGTLLNVELKTTAATIAFYDKLTQHVHTGPHLGAHLTLVLAYNKALYTKDLERIGRWGLNERQVRVSVGLEEGGVLKRVFGAAVEAAEGMMGEGGQ